jgi:hypothetical protein
VQFAHHPTIHPRSSPQPSAEESIVSDVARPNRLPDVGWTAGDDRPRGQLDHSASGSGQVGGPSRTASPPPLPVSPSQPQDVSAAAGRTGRRRDDRRQRPDNLLRTFRTVSDGIRLRVTRRAFPAASSKG